MKVIEFLNLARRGAVVKWDRSERVEVLAVIDGRVMATALPVQLSMPPWHKISLCESYGCREITGSELVQAEALLANR